MVYLRCMDDPRYLLIYNGNPYLLVRKKSKPYSVYGIQLGKDSSDNSELIEISIDKTNEYSYEYTIDNSIPK